MIICIIIYNTNYIYRLVYQPDPLCFYLKDNIHPGPRQFSRLAVEFERGYLGDDGNAKTLHIGT